MIMGKVRKVWIYSFQFSDQYYYENNYHESVIQSYNVYTMAGETLSDYLNKYGWLLEASP